MHDSRQSTQSRNKLQTHFVSDQDDIAIAVVSRHYAVTYFETGNRGCSSGTLRSRLRPASLPVSLCFQPITIPLQLGSATPKLLALKTRGSVTHAFAACMGRLRACKMVVASPARRIFGAVLGG